VEESYWPSEHEMAQASASDIEELRKEIQQLIAQDLRELRERYPGQEPVELLESYHREQAVLANEEQTAIRERQPEERIALVSEGEWQSDFDGLWEHRISIGDSRRVFTTTSSVRMKAADRAARDGARRLIRAHKQPKLPHSPNHPR
jgi:putative component of toxin-antitoxin plasmid stabilization module